METTAETQRLAEVIPHSIPNSASSSSRVDLKYISLRDVLDSPTRAEFGLGHPGDFDFDSTTISIKNQLVKHAASVYLQSAAVLAARDQGFLMRLWRRVLWQQHVARSAWRGFLRRGPFKTCVGFLATALHLAVARIGGALRAPLASPQCN